ncbi:hypothetical protein DPMN_019354 [Dreissena polymorpha]|uniref:Uncharacterized protein n=1 Tax=Dreissena polymorpha TaxID=45954 RepID=A0A9D4NK87_DREPO|nr:hypothetical protein DPMN_019354 [Dreissena polymorpha]
MLKLAQTDQETDQQTNRPTHQQTNRQGKNNISPTTIMSLHTKFEPGISIMSRISTDRESSRESVLSIVSLKKPGIKPGISTSRELSRESSQEIVLSILSILSILSLKQPGITGNQYSEIVLSILSILSLKQPGIILSVLSRSSTEKEPQWKTMRILV